VGYPGTFVAPSLIQFNPSLHGSSYSNLITLLKVSQKDGCLFSETEREDFHEVDQVSSSKASY
jgi:hypothetical protein